LIFLYYVNNVDAINKMITLKSYPNEYIKQIYSQKNFVIDSTRKEILFKG